MPAGFHALPALGHPMPAGFRALPTGLHAMPAGFHPMPAGFRALPAPAFTKLAPASGPLAPASTELALASGQLAPASGPLAPASGQLAPALTELPPASGELRPKAGKLRPKASKLAPALTELPPASGELRPKARKLGPKARKQRRHRSTGRRQRATSSGHRPTGDLCETGGALGSVCRLRDSDSAPVNFFENSLQGLRETSPGFRQRPCNRTKLRVRFRRVFQQFQDPLEVTLGDLHELKRLQPQSALAVHSLAIIDSGTPHNGLQKEVCLTPAPAPASRRPPSPAKMLDAVGEDDGNRLGRGLREEGDRHRFELVEDLPVPAEDRL